MKRNKPNVNELGLTGTCVYVREGESIEQALKRFKKVMIKDDIMNEYRKREYYVSKGQKKRAAKKAAIRRNKLNQMKYKKEY